MLRSSFRQLEKIALDSAQALRPMIGKTRQVEAQASSAAAGGFTQGCGVLRHSPPAGDCRHVRYRPPPQLRAWVEHFWLESWQFATAQIREMLPHPSVHLVFAPRGARIYGVQSGRFVRELSGTGRILGVKFWPGAFYPFLRRPLASITDRSLAAEQIFADVTRAQASVLGSCDERSMIEAAASFLAANLPLADARAQAARCAVEQIAVDRALTRVQQLTARVGVRERTLQRLFERYVGVSPRWVIKRYRLFEALERLSAGGGDPLAALAQSLGYFDQAHFTNEFRRLVGQAPAEYRGPRAARRT